MTQHEMGRRLAWDTYFATLSGFQQHPGVGIDKGYGIIPKLSIEECANLADEMLKERDKRFKEE